MYGVLLFENTQTAVQAESVAEENGIETKLIPVPRELSSNCGIALKFSWEDKERLRDVLSDSGVRVSEIHKIDGVD